jgi:hypothetical protein
VKERRNDTRTGRTPPNLSLVVPRLLLALLYQSNPLQRRSLFYAADAFLSPVSSSFIHWAKSALRSLLPSERLSLTRQCPDCVQVTRGAQVLLLHALLGVRPSYRAPHDPKLTSRTARRTRCRPLANWGLPLAALADLTGKDPEFISGPMTVALSSYSYVRWSVRDQGSEAHAFGRLVQDGVYAIRWVLLSG